MLDAHPYIDQAKDIPAFVQARHPDKGYDVDGVMSELLVYDRRPEGQFIEIRETVSRTVEIVGKTTRTMLRTISLLNLSPEIQAEIRSGNLPVSQGYLFAANLECPDRVKAVNETPSFNRDNNGYKRIRTLKSY